MPVEPVEDDVDQIATATTWAPFRSRGFAWLWLANAISALGAWIQIAAASWIMTDIAPSPIMVSLVQAAAQLPILLLAIPAGALADLVDRRRHLVFTNMFMLVVSGLLVILAQFGHLNAIVLLSLTGLMATGAALNNPAWAASVPLTVPRRSLPQALVLNSIGFNLGRAIGPAISGLLLALAGAAAAFLANAATFTFVAIVVARFLSLPSVAKASAVPLEPFRSAMRIGVSYVLAEPVVRVAIVRAATFFGFASAIWALLPLYVRQVLGLSSGSFGLMMGMIGVGAVIGGLIMPWIRTRLSRNDLIMLASVLCGATLIPLAVYPSASTAMVSLLLFGAGWIMGTSSLQATIQLASAPWVRARVMAIYQAVFNGAMAIGAILWGWLGNHAGLSGTLLAAGLGGCVFAVLMRAAQLPSEISDPSAPSLLDRRTASIAEELAPLLHSSQHPLIVVVTYRIDPSDVEAFRAAMVDVRLARYRAGVVNWALSRDLSDPWHWVETFRMRDWHELQRGIERINRTDSEAVGRAHSYHRLREPPVVSLLLRDQLN